MDIPSELRDLTIQVNAIIRTISSNNGLTLPQANILSSIPAMGISLIDLSNNQSSTFISNNLYFFDEYDISNKTRSKYSEKLKYLYEIFSAQLSNFYSSYSMVAQK